MFDDVLDYLRAALRGDRRTRRTRPWTPRTLAAERWPTRTGAMTTLVDRVDAHAARRLPGDSRRCATSRSASTTSTSRR
ncbi:MAG: hypothetical protein MZW92_51200 [Comamonadaceae bacterium]|nr:hypothetical protein [Comamonadaceae bacterium]